MNQNVKIAKQLIRIAKNLIALESKIQKSNILKEFVETLDFSDNYGSIKISNIDIESGNVRVNFYNSYYNSTDGYIFFELNDNNLQIEIWSDYDNEIEYFNETKKFNINYINKEDLMQALKKYKTNINNWIRMSFYKINKISQKYNYISEKDKEMNYLQEAVNYQIDQQNGIDY